MSNKSLEQLTSDLKEFLQGKSESGSREQGESNPLATKHDVVTSIQSPNDEKQVLDSDQEFCNSESDSSNDDKFDEAVKDFGIQPARGLCGSGL